MNMNMNINMSLNKELDGKEIGVGIRDKNFHGTPQFDWFDFFINLIIFDSSIGLVLILLKSDKTSIMSSLGGSSVRPGRVDLLAKFVFNKSLFFFFFVTIF